MAGLGHYGANMEPNAVLHANVPMMNAPLAAVAGKMPYGHLPMHHAHVPVHYGGYPSMGAILVLFILLVIISRSFLI